MKFPKEKDPILAGLQVLDLADEKASYCGKLLADLGAQVIKVEPPGGDLSRKIGPFFTPSHNQAQSLFFLFNNTNKQGVTLDLREAQEKQIFLGLVQNADIVLESFQPGKLDRLGIGFETLSKANPGIILTSVTGFGQTGPLRDYKSCDLVASAVGGQMYVSGLPSNTPLKIFGQQSYFVASLYAAVGILLALQNRRQSGQGEQIDISLQEAVASTLEHVMVNFFSEGIVPKRQGSLHWNNAFCILPCTDGFIHLTLFQQWETLVEWMAGDGKAQDLQDSKWNDESYRQTHVDHVIDVLREWTKDKSVGELFELGQLMHFPWAPVQSPQDIAECPQLKARQFFVDTDHSEFNQVIRYPGLPYQFTPRHNIHQERPPHAGGDNAQIIGNNRNENQRKTTGPSIGNGTLKKDAILHGVRILDFTRVLAGPYATRILADFGAEVIKVQSGKTATGAEANDSDYFNNWNRNKKSITLDLSHDDARDIALQLISLSDVAIENFSPRVMSNWGLQYEILKTIKPDLIMVSMSAMGQTGPWKDFVAFGPTLQSLGALSYLTSYDNTLPVGPGYAYADTAVGLYGALAVLTGLEHRALTGQGLYVDLSGYEAVCTLNGSLFLDLFANHGTVQPSGNRSEHIPAAPYGCYPCAGTDRWCVIAVFNDREWEALCKVMERPDWSKEERFSTLDRRKAESEALDGLIGHWTSRYKAEKLVHLLQQKGICAGVVQNAEELAHDPQLLARDFFVHLDHPVLGHTVSDGSPIKFRHHSPIAGKASPSLGDDNQYVYRDLLGLTKKELAEYAERGIIS